MLNSDPVKRQRKKRRNSLFSLNIMIKRNPSILLGISLPFVIATAISLKAVAAVTLEMLAINLAAALAIAVTAKMQALWARVIINVGVTTLVMIAIRFLIRALFPETANYLGAYVYLMGLNGIVLLLSAPRQRESGESLLLLLRRVLLHTGAFGILMLLVALPREYMGYGTLWGRAVPIVFKLQGVQLPFFGFISAGLMLAAIKFLSKKITYWKVLDDAHRTAREEARYTRIRIEP